LPRIYSVARNTLSYGDNLDMRDYNALFKEAKRDENQAQTTVFTATKGMRQEVEEIGFFEGPSGRKIPRLQICTIKELIEGKEFGFSGAGPSAPPPKSSPATASR